MKDLSHISLNCIQRLIDLGRLDVQKPIDLRALKSAGINFNKEGVRITADVSRIAILLAYLSYFGLGLEILLQQRGNGNDRI